MDFNPWDEITESLLFDWDELFTYGEKDKTKSNNENNENGQEDEVIDVDDINNQAIPVFRIVESQGAIRPTLAMTNRLPSDLVDLSNSAAITDFVQNFGKLNANEDTGEK